MNNLFGNIPLCGFPIVNKTSVVGRSAVVGSLNLISNYAHRGVKSSAKRLAAMLFTVGLLSATGCTTTVVNPIATSDAQSTAHRDVRVAAEKLSVVDWPKPTDLSLTARLAGVVSGDDDRVTRSDAIESYVAILEQTPQPATRLAADADKNLRAAEALAIAAEQAAYKPAPSMDDVDVLEKAISDLRQTRDIYLASLREITVDPETSSVLGRALKDDFARALKNIGDAADLLADRAAQSRAQLMAKPSVQSFLIGSL